MRLLRQASLYFREGTADKVYEIDLCSVGNDAYVVNFRYGRRGTVLKEGTKTTEPVSLYKAEEIFQVLEAEKRAKGYKALSEETETPAVSSPLPKPQLQFTALPPGPKSAVLKRLQAAVDEVPAKRFQWKTSRVMWAAGLLRLTEAADAVLYLSAKGDAVQEYAALWALGRCGTKAALPFFLQQFKNGKPAAQRLAGAALLRVTEGAEREKHLQFYVHSLPEAFQAAVKSNDHLALQTLLQERVLSQVQPHYNVLEDLYLLAQEQLWIKRSVKELLAVVPLKPGYFRHVRHLFKLAEFFDDFETLGLLAHRFEKEAEFFRQSSAGDGDDGETFVPELSQYVPVKKELQKRNSRLAYSNRTRQYLIRRSLRMLNQYGAYGDLHYVRMATGLLLAYDQEADATAPSSRFDYVWRKGTYERIETKFPANAAAVYLNQILYGNSPHYRLSSANVWITVEAAAGPAKASGAAASQSQNNGEGKEGIVKKIIGFFTGKRAEPTPQKATGQTASQAPADASTPSSLAANEAPYLSLWNSLPQAYVQLLMHGRMNDVHRFALANLQRHPDYAVIKNKLDAAAIEQLLLSAFDLPAAFAFDLAQERYNPANPDKELVKAMLYGKLPAAQQKAKAWVEASKDAFLSDTAFVAALLLSPNADVRAWIDNLLGNCAHSEEAAREIVGRTVVHLLAMHENTADVNETVRQAGEILNKRFAPALKALDPQIAQRLLQSKAAAVQMLGVDVLLQQKENLSFDALSSEVLSNLINNDYAPLRAKGMDLLAALSTEELLRRQPLVMACCTSAHADVRHLVRPLLKRMAEKDATFGVQAAEWLLPHLLRKEVSEGLHRDVAEVLRHELLSFLKEANKELVLRLLYSSFTPTQEFGITLLQTVVEPNDFTLRQIIALGNHETKAVREWAWQYFEANTARIRYEREDAIRLLDASWDDTRAFAKDFFRKAFGEKDWTPEVLVGLADSVRPDVEAYGRELITRFFRDEQGEEYLLKLSQHPSEKMQLFATAYLERFAANNLAKLQSLEFYFRSVLTRVNKARVAKNRVFRFLGEEGKKSEAAAQFVAALLGQISATASVEDKAKCIEILLTLQSLFNVQTPLRQKPVEERI